MPGEMGECDGLGEGEVFVEVFEGEGVVGSNVERKDWVRVRLPIVGEEFSLPVV